MLLIDLRRLAPALTALVVALLAWPASGDAATATATLRVLTPAATLDPGTAYVVGRESIRTDPEADCNFGGSGGTGARYTFDRPTAMGLLRAGARHDADLRPLSITDEFGFGLAICAIGGHDDDADSFWYLKRNHRESTKGADILPVRDGDEVLLYLSPDNFPSPNPAELDLSAPAGVAPGGFEVIASQWTCAYDPEVDRSVCQKSPAAGVAVTGASAPTDAQGRTTVTAGEEGPLVLRATRGEDIPAPPVEVCVDSDPAACPEHHGQRIVGRDVADRIAGTRGWDEIAALRGDDRIGLRAGGRDQVACGGGRDTVVIDAGDGDDDLASCERVIER